MSTLDWAVAQALGGKEIGSELYRLRADQEERLRTEQTELGALCAKAEALRPECETQADANVAFTNAQNVLALAPKELRSREQDIQRAEQALEAYRLRHGLTRGPIDPNTAQKLFLLAILLFGEAGINAGFFQNAYMAASPLAALLISLLISITNITVNTCAGYFIGRWKDYGANAADADASKFLSARRQAKGLFWVFLVAVGFFHATVGLIRATESLISINHTLASYVALVTTPESVFLVLTGACFSIFAYHKGKEAFDDPYPGYGQRHRAVKDLKEELHDRYEDFLEQIEAHFADDERALNKQTKARERTIEQYNKAVGLCLEARRKLVRAVSAAESELRMQVAQLSTHHQAARGRKNTVTERSLDQIISFNVFLQDELPTYVQPVHQYAQKTQLANAKSAALKQLSDALQNHPETNFGES